MTWLEELVEKGSRNTAYGFIWGEKVEVSRAAILPSGHRVLLVDAGAHRVEVYVSRTTRSVRVFKDGKELK